MRTRNWKLLGLVAAALLAFGCGSIAPGKAELRYNSFVGNTRRTHALPPGTRSISARITLRETGEPVEGLRMTILTRGEPIVLVSDANGVLRLPIRDDLEAENPRMHIDKKYEGKLEIWCGGPVPLGDAILVSPAGRERLEGEGYSVWYSPGMEAQAERVSKWFSRAREVIARVTGLEPAAYGVVLLPEEKEGARNRAHRFHFDDTTFGFNPDRVRSPYFKHVNVHEWTETTLMDRLSFIYHSADNRFITDGLSEYAAFIAAGEYLTDIRYLEDILADGTTHVNLLKRFRRISGTDIPDEKALFYPGYSLSFVFWYNLCEAHGEELPARFLAEMKTRKKRDAKDAIAVLEKLTGQTDIRYRLENADVAKTINTLKTVAPAEAPQATAPTAR